MLQRNRLVLCAICLAALGTAATATWKSADGHLSVSPTKAVAGNFGTWTVTYRVGSRGIAEGGAIRVQLPDSWHAGDRNSANRLQATDPEGDHYISSRSSREDVRLKTEVESETRDYLVKSPRPGLDGRLERYVFVVRIIVEEGELQDGDTLSVMYGDTSKGSRGMKGGIVSTPPEPILAVVDNDGTGEFQRLPDDPTVQIVSRPAAELRLSGPSALVVNKPATLLLSVVDEHGNPSTPFAEQVGLQVVQGEADVPPSVSFTRGQGWARVDVTPKHAGVVRIEATAEGGILQTVGNPMMVHESPPERRIYWGDLHSHSHYSWDGVGRNPYEYARDISHLDFYSLTDHSRTSEKGFTRGLGPHVWEEYAQLAERYYRPGAFVTLFAYEASFGAPYGHRNVYFRGRPGPLLAPEAATLPELWKALTAGEALTIPHHTGAFPGGVRWEHHDPEFQRNFEIYSAHGLSEAYEPDHPLAFEQSDFSAPRQSARGPQFAQDAWMAGLVLSTIAATDDHRAHPGRPHWGLSAVSANDLTRAEIFDALYDRRTYGTTGARILLNFRINGQSMGTQISAQNLPLLEVEAHGTDVIEELEVLRYCQTDGGFEVIRSIKPHALDLHWTDTDRTFREDSIYYVRLRQKRMVQNRIAMAWSSPIWVTNDARTNGDGRDR
ncbi:MAG: DUF3604 domain-containing protein [Luteitalea sp.]|nr:DUF3604 domain-containing protein [Luteitalea sp.]